MSQVDSAEMPVTAEPEITDVIIAAAFASEGGRAFNEAILVEEKFLALAIPIINRRDLTLKTKNREILPIKVSDEDVVLAEFSLDVIEPAVRVLCQTPEPCEIVLENIITSGTKKTRAEQ